MLYSAKFNSHKTLKTERTKIIQLLELLPQLLMFPQLLLRELPPNFSNFLCLWLWLVLCNDNYRNLNFYFLEEVDSSLVCTNAS